MPFLRAFPPALTVFVKVISVFFVGIPLLGIVLNKGLRNWIKDPKVYLMAAISLVPALIYNVLSATVGGNASSIFGTRFFPNLFIQTEFYAGWGNPHPRRSGVWRFPHGVDRNPVDPKAVAAGVLLLHVAGLRFIRSDGGLSYLHPQLLPLAPFPDRVTGVGIFAGVVINRLEKVKSHLADQGFGLRCIFPAHCREYQRSQGHAVCPALSPRQKAFWSVLGDKIGHNTKVIALTQDYGGRLSYFGLVGAQIWSSIGDFRLTALSGGTDPVVESSSRKRPLAWIISWSHRWVNLMRNLCSKNTCLRITPFNQGMDIICSTCTQR